MAKPDIAHIGYHRTGTNFLQNVVFPQLDGQIFRSSHSGKQFFSASETFDEPAAQAFFAREQERNLSELPVLISHESLTGTSLKDDLTPTARLAQLNPEVRIILVLRSQYDIFRSLYHLHVKGTGKLDVSAFLEQALSGGKCDYLTMVEHLLGLFGKDRLLVLLYEDLRAAPDAFVGEVYRFLGAEPPAAQPLPKAVNARAPDQVLRFRRFANAALGIEQPGPSWKVALRELGTGAVYKTAALQGRRPLVGERDRERIRERYAEGNRRLAALLDLPLAERGYPA